MSLPSLIKSLHLEPHPEGGHYREYFRSDAVTSIWFLLAGKDVSHFHRLAKDEIWYWHEGGVVVMHMIHPDGTYTATRIGPPNLAHSYVCVLPAGTWFGATCEGDHVLVSAMVAPAFSFADFELAQRDQLLAEYPQYAGIIRELTGAMA